MKTRTKANLAAAAVGATLLTVLLVKGPYHGEPLYTVRWTNANTVMATCTNLLERDWVGATSNQLIITKSNALTEPMRFFMPKPIPTSGVWTVRLMWDRSIDTNVTGYIINFGLRQTNIGQSTSCIVPFIIGEPIRFGVRATNQWTNSEPATLSNLAVNIQ